MYNGVSSYADKVDATFMFIFISCAILLAIVTLFMVYCIVKYSKSRNPVPADIDGHVGLEILWTVIPTILVMGMFFSGKDGFDRMRDVPNAQDPNAVTVDVKAAMWSWTFEYDNGKKPGELTVPVGRPVFCRLKAEKVLHSFYIPAFRIKEDVVPGGSNMLWFQAEKEGTYDVFCAEYCGTQHSAMLTKVHVVSQEEYEKWYSTPDKVEITPESGKEIVHGKKANCVQCHTVDGSNGIGPTFKGLYNRKGIATIDGQEQEYIANDEYIHTSIVNPGDAVVKGYPNAMQSFGERLSEDEIKAIIEYLKSIQ